MEKWTKEVSEKLGILLHEIHNDTVLYYNLIHALKICYYVVFIRCSTYISLYVYCSVRKSQRTRCTAYWTILATVIEQFTIMLCKTSYLQLAKTSRFSKESKMKQFWGFIYGIINLLFYEVIQYVGLQNAILNLCCYQYWSFSCEIHKNL